MGPDPSKTPASPELVSIAEAAARLRCGNQTIRDMISRGQLPAYRVGGRMIRLATSEVDALLNPIVPANTGAGA